MNFLQTLRRALFGQPTWLPAWVRDRDGEVYAAEYRRVGGIYVVRCNDRMIQGHPDGTTSNPYRPFWWPEVAPLEMALRLESPPAPQR